eukprot:m.145097 g.145097  ORF g.145097 m.145097 type:complete len:1112 (+) comp16213_c0_seq5:51-3386(+)
MLLRLLSCLLGMFAMTSATSLFVENFDTRAAMTLSPVFAAPSSGDYFGLTGGSVIDFGGSTNARPPAYTGMNGSHLAMEDANGLPGTLDNEVKVTWSSIDLQGSKCVAFSGLFAEDTGSAGIDDADYLVVEYSLGSSSDWNDLVRFEGGLEFNSYFQLAGTSDTANRLAIAAKEFGAEISDVGSATKLNLRLRVSVTSGKEDAGVDSFRLVSCDAGADSTTISAVTTTTATAIATATSTTAASITTSSSTISTEALSTSTDSATSTTSVVTEASTTPLTTTFSSVGLFFENFDTKAAMTLSPGFGAPLSNDFFGLIGGDASDFGSDSDPSVGPITGMDGSRLVAEDSNKVAGASNGASVTWVNINLQGRKCVSFSGLFAEATASNGNNDIDIDDVVRVEYQLAGASSWTTLLEFAGNQETNGLFQLKDGTASDVLGEVAKIFTAEISDVGEANTLSLRLFISLNAGDEDIAVDSFRLTPCEDGSTGSPASPTSAQSTSSVTQVSTQVSTQSASKSASTLEPFTTTSKITSTSTTQIVSTTTTKAPITTTKAPLIDRNVDTVFFEPFNSRALMARAAPFAAKVGGVTAGYLGLTGGAADDFGQDATPVTLDTYQNMTGSYLVAEASSRLAGIVSQAQFEWHNIPTRGARCLTFEGLFAGRPNKVDTSDYIHVDYKLSEAKLWRPLVRFVSNARPHNGDFALDADFDGRPDEDGFTLQSTAAVASALTRPVNGAAVDLRLTFGLDAGDEAIGMDSFHFYAVECPEEVLLEEGFDDPSSITAEPAFYSEAGAFFGIQTDDSLFGGMTGSYLVQQGAVPDVDRRRASAVTYTTWNTLFDIAFVDRVAVGVNLSSNGVAASTDSVELQVDIDSQNSWVTLARFVGDGTVLRQDTNLDGMANVDAAVISQDSTFPFRHTFIMDVKGNSLKLRFVITFESATVDVAMDDVNVVAAFVAPPPTVATTTAEPKLGASANNSDGQVGAIIGGVLGGCLVLALVTMSLLLAKRRRTARDGLYNSDTNRDQVAFSNPLYTDSSHNRLSMADLDQLEAGQAGEELYNEPSFNQARHVANPLFDGDEEGEGEVVVAEDNQLEQPSVAEMGEEDYLDVNDPEDGAQ